MNPRRGWRETVEPGVRRHHTVACPRSSDRKPRRRCKCPWSLKVPGVQPGTVTDETFTGSLTEARNHRRMRQANGRPVAKVPSCPTLHEWAKHYFRANSGRWAPATVVSRDRSYRLHIQPRLGGYLLSDLDASVAQEWIDRFGGVRSRHMELAHATLRAMLNRAVKDGVMDYNPVLAVELPEGKRYIADENFALTNAQLSTLVTACSNLRDETLVRVAAEAGLRRGELAGLRWSDIDLDAQRINVNLAIWQDKKVGKIAKAPKTGAARRVAVSRETVERLREYRAEQAARFGSIPSGPVWPGRGSRKKGQGWDTTQPMSPSSISHAVGRLMRRAKLVDASGDALLGTQGLRRTAGSIPLMAGQPTIVVAKQLGHSRVTTTASYYARAIQDEQLDDLAAVFERKPEGRGNAAGG